MPDVPPLTPQLYREHLVSSARWLKRSIQKGRGGSCAYFSLVGGWAKPYPETSGYLTPTLLGLGTVFPELATERMALDVGRWLLAIRDRSGCWYAGLHPPKGDAKPSVFNTAQVLTGIVALYRHTGDKCWLDAVHQASIWLASKVNDEGLWPSGDYRSETMPSYYTHAVWPLLQAWEVVQDDRLRRASVSTLHAVLRRRQANGVFSGWAFEADRPAFTHTIAYTLWGLMGSATILDDWETFGKPVERALRWLARQAELTDGKLPGAFDASWKPVGDYVCLSGNAQLALCLLTLERRTGELQLVNAARKLVDYVCHCQNLTSPITGVRGGVAGSAPVWGRYMTLRYPNWASKYHCDALMQLTARLVARPVEAREHR